MLYQSFSGDAGTGTASFTAKNSTLRNFSDGAMFYITNTKAVASLTNTVIESPNNKNLIEVAATAGGRKVQTAVTLNLRQPNKLSAVTSLPTKSVPFPSA